MAAAIRLSSAASRLVAARVLAGAVGLVVTACAKPSCDLGAMLRQQAGSSARDCGHAQADETNLDSARPVDAGQGDGGQSDAGPGVLGGVDECVTTAFTDGKPFYAQYDRSNVGVGVVFGIAGNGAGRVWFMTYAPRPSSRTTSGSLGETECNEPSVDMSAERDPSRMAPILCRSTTPVGQFCADHR